MRTQSPELHIVLVYGLDDHHGRSLYCSVCLSDAFLFLFLGQRQYWVFWRDRQNHEKKGEDHDDNSPMITISREKEGVVS